MLIVWRVVLLLTTFPLRLIELPLRTNAPAPLRNCIPLNWVPAAKSLLLVVLVLPPKLRMRLGTGAVPPQLAGVVQLLSAPPPFQVAVVTTTS